MLKRLVHQPSIVFIDVFIYLTRMHSSRMRTGRSLTVCRGGALPIGGSLPGGFPAGASPCPWGSPWPGGLPAQGGLLARGVSLPGVGFSLPETPPPVNRITHSCKNITLATTSLRLVMTYVLAFLDKCRLK